MNPTPRRWIPDSTIQLVLEKVSSGESLGRACASAGIGRASFYEWIRDDSDLAGRYAEAVKQQTLARYL